MNPGELREPVAFYSLIKTEDGAGGSTATETLVFKTLARIVTNKPARDIENGQLRLITTRTVTIRYAKNRMPEIDMLMKWRGDTYQIITVDEPDEMKMLITLIVSRS